MNLEGNNVLMFAASILAGTFAFKICRYLEPSKPEDTDPTSRSSSSSDSSDDEDDDGFRFPPSYSIKDNYSMLDGKFKMVLCVNSSLHMGKGKIAAQCGHATLGAYRLASRYAKSAVKWWYTLGQAKIAVKVPNDEALHELERKAMDAGLVVCMIQDAGHTQVAPGSHTVLAIGPAPTQAIDSITGDFKLL